LTREHGLRKYSQRMRDQHEAKNLQSQESILTLDVTRLRVKMPMLGYLSAIFSKLRRDARTILITCIARRYPVFRDISRGSCRKLR